MQAFSIRAAWRPEALSLLAWRRIGLNTGTRHQGILRLRSRFIDFLRDKAAPRDEKYKGEDESAYDVVLDRPAPIRPYKNASCYLPDA
jgi:hypothetical protein